MFYAIRHITRFKYEEPIFESVMEVMMQPRAEGAQRLISFALNTTPRATVLAYNDHLGNIVHHFDILKPHAELTLEAMAQIEVGHVPPPPLRVDAAGWNGLSPEWLGSEEYDMLNEHGFAAPTELLRQFMVEQNIVRLEDPLSTLHAISNAIHAAFDYDTKATKVDSPIDHALSQKRGVCQDFAHIMIAVARRLGMPTRYVSGYLHHQRSADLRSNPGATHAWVESFVPSLGWVAFDPTNGVAVSERHIRVAVGHDYADVPPTRGTFKGNPAAELEVSVVVQPGGAPLKPAEFMKLGRPSPVVPLGVDPLAQQQQEQQQQ